MKLAEESANPRYMNAARSWRVCAGRAAGQGDGRLRTPRTTWPVWDKIVIRCGKCGRENRPGRRFCAGCGTALDLKCRQCGASNEPDERYCGQCGSVVAMDAGSGAAERQPAPAVLVVSENSDVRPPDGERKTVTA